MKYKLNWKKVRIIKIESVQGHTIFFRSEVKKFKDQSLDLLKILCNNYKIFIIFTEVVSTRSEIPSEFWGEALWDIDVL